MSDALFWTVFPIAFVLTLAVIHFATYDPLVRGEEQDVFRGEPGYSKGISRRVLK